MEQVAGSPAYASMSKIQASAIKDLCAEVELSPEAKSTLAQAVITVRWASHEHHDMILDVLSEDDSRTAKKARRRRDMQDFRCLYLYLSEDMWAVLLDPEGSTDAKLQAIMQHALRLGMRLPSEPTSKMLCSLWLLVSCQVAELNSMDNVSKAIRLQRFKNEFGSLRLKWPDPVAWVATLPESTCEYMAKYKVLYDAAFNGRAPTAPKIAGDVLAAFDMSYTCRGGMKQYVGVGFKTESHGTALAVAAVPKVASMPHMGQAMGGIEAFQQMAVTFMQQMANSQQKMIEMMMGGTSPPPNTRLVSMAALQDRAEALSMARAMPPPMVPLALPAMPPLEAEAVTTAFAEEVPSPPPQARPEQKGDEDSMADVFELLQHRKEAAKLAAKAKALANAVAAAQPPSGSAAPLKAKGHAAAPCKAQATVVSSVPPKAAAAAAVPPKAKASAVPPNGKAKAKVAAAVPASVPPKAKAKVSAAVPALILGCGKCRWSVGGCGQCRRPDFTGKRWNVTAGPRTE